MNITPEQRMTRERRKNQILGIVCLIMSASMVAMLKLWTDLAAKGQEMPVAAYLAVIAVAVLYLAVGISCLRSASNRFGRDYSFVADLYWMTAIFLFITLTASGMAQGEPGASTASIVGLAVLITGAVYKLIDSIKTAELRIRENLLARSENPTPPVA